jgi:ubiquinone/menaquinone biosynthesis C-methylase UbiE
MTAPSSPLATPMAWDLVAEGYTIDIVPLLEKFAEDALRMAAVAPGERVLDVAAGPGTLSLLAARTAMVSAIDFSPAMLQSLQAKSKAAGVEVDARLGDGMQLPWRDETFSAAFSMFGLMFFPDRRRGFAELLRVLRPGGRAVVSSWVPMERVPLLDAFYRALKAELPELPLGDDAAPLTQPDHVRAELSQAGFAGVSAREVSHGVDIPSVREFLASAKRSNAALMLLAQKLGSDAFQSLLDSIEARLLSTFGSGPLRVEFIALLGYGVRPRRTT